MCKIKILIKFLLNFIGFVLHHNRKSKVIYYHDVGTQFTSMGTPLTIIKKQLEIVRKCGFEIVPQLTSKNNQVMIAFDDGWKGLYEERFFFIKNQIKPTVFVAVDLIGRDGFMNIHEIQELQAEGFIFESHTWSHKGLPDYISEESLRHELYDSKCELERLIGKEISSLCFPQGRFSDKVIEMSKIAGYKKLYSSIPGGAYDMYNRGLICRLLFADIPVNQVRFVIEGCSYIYKKKIINNHYSR